MTAAVLPDLDAETVEELRPPCDTKYHPPRGAPPIPCPQPAAWVTRIRCDHCQTVHDGLMCDTHKGYFFDVHGLARCAGCSHPAMRYTCLSAERL